MVIRTKENNKTIIKQLIELLNNAFDNSLNSAIENYWSFETMKRRIIEQEVGLDEGFLLARFISDWIDYTNAYNSFVLDQYVSLMRENNSKQLRHVFHAFREKFYKVESKPSPFFEQTLIPLTIRVKEHSGTIEESLLAIVKPFLVEELIVLLMNESDSIIELLSIMNNYNDYNYHLQRFISVFEENLLEKKETTTSLELLAVWWLDETFLKETIIPELKKRTLTGEQKQKAAIPNSCKELVNNYYDYCLYYAGAKTRCGLTSSLIDTVFFYEKEDFVKAMSIVKNTLWINTVNDEDLLYEYNSLLRKTINQKPEWVDSLRLLLPDWAGLE